MYLFLIANLSSQITERSLDRRAVLACRIENRTIEAISSQLTAMHVRGGEDDWTLCQAFSILTETQPTKSS